MTPLGILDPMYDAALYLDGAQASPFGYHSSQIPPVIGMSADPGGAGINAPFLDAALYLPSAPVQSTSADLEAMAAPGPVAKDSWAETQGDVWGGSESDSGDDEGKSDDWRKKLFGSLGKGLQGVAAGGGGGSVPMASPGAPMGILEGIQPQYVLPLLQLALNRGP